MSTLINHRNASRLAFDNGHAQQRRRFPVVVGLTAALLVLAGETCVETVLTPAGSGGHHSYARKIDPNTNAGINHPYMKI
jgi:hypothetical protein